MNEQEIEKEWEKDWEQTWKPCILNDKGELDMEKIKNEMHDLVFIYKQVGKVYMSITGGLMSKPMYYADEVIAHHEDAVSDAVEDFKNDMLEDIKGMDKDEIIKYLST